MTDQLVDLVTKIANTIKIHSAHGRNLARDPYQKGIQTAGDYVTGQVLLKPEETQAFLEMFSGNPEIALRTLRERLDSETAQLLPEGAGGLTLRYSCRTEGANELALYTTPLYDIWYYNGQTTRSSVPA